MWCRVPQGRRGRRRRCGRCCCCSRAGLLAGAGGGGWQLRGGGDGARGSRAGKTVRPQDPVATDFEQGRPRRPCRSATSAAPALLFSPVPAAGAAAHERSRCEGRRGGHRRTRRSCGRSPAQTWTSPLGRYAQRMKNLARGVAREEGAGLRSLDMVIYMGRSAT